MKQRSKTLFTIAGAFIVLAAMLYSCGGGGGGYGSSSGMPPAPITTVQAVACPASGTTDVSIVSMTAPGFNPSSITVPVNTIVKWTNNDATMTPHTVTSTTVPLYGAFDSGQMSFGSSVCFKFTSAGTFNYHCSNHPATMIGLVTVQ
jgi:plastocyanin